MHHAEEITRRNFFSRTAFFFGATLMTRTFGRGQDERHAIGLGFSLYGMKSLDIATALEAVSKIGYDCVELPVMKEWPADSATFSRAEGARWRDLLAARRLRLSALMDNLPALGDEASHQANLERLKRAAEMARVLEPNDARRPVIETIMGGKAGDFETVKAKLVERLRDWAKVMEEAEVKLAVKAHIGNATQQPSQLLWLLQQVASPWLVAAYDYSHFELQDLDIKDTTDMLLPRSAFIHVKDTEKAQGKRSFLLPGEGTTDYVRLLKLVSQSNYQGDVVVEVSSQLSNRPDYEPLAAARKCYNHLARAFSEAGVTRG